VFNYYLLFLFFYQILKKNINNLFGLKKLISFKLLIFKVILLLGIFLFDLVNIFVQNKILNRF
jgi:hypothetical protein